MIKDKLNKLMKEQITYPSFNDLQQRGIADMFEAMACRIITDNFDDVNPARGPKSIEDINIGDVYVDIKTSDESKKQKQPNMISVERLQSVVSSGQKLIYVFIIYNSKQAAIKEILCMDLYELNVDHLTFGNLGTGQMQINGVDKFLTSPKTTLTKEQWVSSVNKKTVDFYINLIKVTEERIKTTKSLDINNSTSVY